MSWNKVIEETKKIVSFRLGNHSHNETRNKIIALKISLIVNDDNTPIMWTIESVKVSPSNAREALQSLDIL